MSEPVVVSRPSRRWRHRFRVLLELLVILGSLAGTAFLGQRAIEKGLDTPVLPAVSPTSTASPEASFPSGPTP